VVLSEGDHGRMIVQLEPDPLGKFYDVKTATPSRDNQYKNKKPLWERAGTSTTPAEAGSLHPRDQGGADSVSQEVPSSSMKQFDAAIENTGAEVVEGKVSKSTPEQIPKKVSEPKRPISKTKLPEPPPKTAPRKEIEKYLRKKGVLEAIYKPGAVVPVYGGWDKVLSYDPDTDTVKAQESDADGKVEPKTDTPLSEDVSGLVREIVCAYPKSLLRSLVSAEVRPSEEQAVVVALIAEQGRQGAGRRRRHTRGVR
jgi:hypothetical protein